jgi:hypothetical protein
MGCKFLYEQDHGYSNYTVEETDMECAKNRNPHLPSARPWDWHKENDNWPKTRESRCDLYAPGKLVSLDVDNEETVESQTDDAEQLEAIRAHSGRNK